MKKSLFAALLVGLALVSGPCIAADAPPLPTTMRLQGRICADTVNPLVVNLQKIGKLPKEQRPAAVILEIDSEGGEYPSFFLLAKVIEMSPFKVFCTVDGTAASGAFYVLQSCDQRVATARSILMWHGASVSDATVNARNAPSLFRYLETVNAGMAHHVSKKLKIPFELVVQKMAEGDWWMTPDEALTIGALDAVIP